MFLNWYALTREIVNHVDFDEGEFPVAVVIGLTNAFEIIDPHTLRQLRPKLSKQGRELLEQIEADYGE